MVLNKEEAEKVKEEANKFFRDQNFDKAIDLYSKAIELYSEEPSYYGNRSFAYLKQELYGYALDDASKAVELDPKYVKGYYRRATANMAIGKFKKALKDYESVYKVRPKDPDAKAKFVECQRIVRKLAFEKAIAVDTPTKCIADTIDFASMSIENDYEGPKLDEVQGISLEFMKDLMETFKKQGKLHRRYAYKILMEINEVFRALPTLCDITIPKGRKFTICGDIHGQFYDLLNIFEINGLPSPDNPYLFNGDFVDRGSFSLETILTLFGFKLLYPEYFFMSRGNHESEVMNQMYGFEGEVRSKYSQQMADFFTEIFNWLPLAHLINQKVLVMHGGLFKEDGVTLEEIRKTRRDRQPPEEGIMCDLLWSDPHPLPGRMPSKRGVGIQFGCDVTKKFCAANGLQYVIRSHEVKPEGYEICHNGQCVTVFSAPNYCDTMGNKGAFVVVNGSDLTPKFKTYLAVDHPKVRPMAYANSLLGFL